MLKSKLIKGCFSTVVFTNVSRGQDKRRIRGVNGDKMRSRYGVKCVFGNETRMGRFNYIYNAWLDGKINTRMFEVLSVEE